MDETPLIIAKPSLAVFITCILGMGFFGWITCVIYNPANISKATIYYALVVFFALATMGSLITLLIAQSFELTQKTLIVKRPFLFLKRIINLSDVETITEKPFKVESTSRGSTILIHTGSKTTIKLINGSKITIDTFSTRNYEELIKQLKHQYRLK